MARRDQFRRLERLEATTRPPGVRVVVVIDEAHADRVELEHQAAADRRQLIAVITGVPRSEGS